MSWFITVYSIKVGNRWIPKLDKSYPEVYWETDIYQNTCVLVNHIVFAEEIL